MARRFGAWGVTLTVFALVSAGCAVVIPQPPQGEPVPQLVLTASQVEPFSGQVTITATPVDFVPDFVNFRHNGDPPIVDMTAPFEATFDTTAYDDGLQTFLAIGNDGTYTVISAQQWWTRNDPNVVYILVDDLDETTTSYWDALPQTQALLANQGLTFTEAYATDPVCCPARATTLTGRYPHNTGIFDNSAPDGGFTVFRSNGSEADTVATRLQSAGFNTAFLGKYLVGYQNTPSYVPPGWDEWFAFSDHGFFDGYDYDVNHNGTIVSYGSDPADYQTDVLATQADAFLDSTEAEDHQPFFLFVSPSAPHLPIPPAPRHLPNPFGSDPLPTLPNFNEADVSDKPTWLRDGVASLDAAAIQSATDDHRLRMGSLLAVDDLVASIVAKLTANGELADTVIVFTSDNGYNLGSHRLPAKQAPYEESIRVPLVISGPGVTTGSDAHFATHVDMVPTVLDLAGLDWSDLDGTSLVPLFQGGSPTWRTDFLVEFNGTYAPYAPDYHTLAQVQAGITAGNPILVPTYQALRTDQWLYVEWYADPVHEYELYDMALDPYQLDNLVATPQGAQDHAATTAALQARLDTLAACAGATCRN